MPDERTDVRRDQRGRLAIVLACDVEAAVRACDVTELRERLRDTTRIGFLVLDVLGLEERLEIGFALRGLRRRKRRGELHLRADVTPFAGVSRIVANAVLAPSTSPSISFARP